MSGRESVLKRPTPPPESFRFVIGRQYSRAGAPERHRDDTAHVPCSAHGRRVGRLPAPRFALFASSTRTLLARSFGTSARRDLAIGAGWRAVWVGRSHAHGEGAAYPCRLRGIAVAVVVGYRRRFFGRDKTGPVASAGVC